MPFGLANVPATFQAYINYALLGLLDICCVVYLDDILIYSLDHEQYIHDVRSILERLRSYKLYAKLSKCVFHTDTVTFLGFVISPTGIAMEESRITMISEWPILTCLHDVLQFKGFAGFYHRFINNFARTIAPLDDLSKGVPNKKKANQRIEDFI